MKRGRDKFKRYKWIIKLITGFYSIFPKPVIKKLLVLHRKQTGKLGLVIRYSLLKNIAKHVGDNVSIQPDVYLFNVDKLSLGNNVSIHPLSYIEASGGVTIGNDVSVAHGVTIMSESHVYSDINLPIKDQSLSFQEVKICDNVWIGEKAVVRAGRNIGTGSIIGAGAVVTKDVAPFSIMAGVPATVLKKRK